MARGGAGLARMLQATAMAMAFVGAAARAAAGELHTNLVDPRAEGEDMDARPEDAPRGVWADVELVEPMRSIDTYLPMQYLVDYMGEQPHVFFRGWAQAKHGVRPGETLFTLPPDAWPAREERFRVAFKGTNRELVVGTDGVATATLPLDRSLWIPLAGFSYAAYTGEDRPSGGGAAIGSGTAGQDQEPAGDRAEL